jgi:hypothetical protein
LIQITDGISEDEVVATTNLDRLQTGSKVRQ